MTATSVVAEKATYLNGLNEQAEWCEVARETHAADARNPYPYSFVTLQRI